MGAMTKNCFVMGDFNLNMPYLSSKEHELKSYETARVVLGLFLNFTFVTIRGPNKLLKLKLKIEKNEKLIYGLKINAP